MENSPAALTGRAFWSRVALAVLIEATYMVVSRYIIARTGGLLAFDTEVYRTGLRMAAGLAYWFLLKDLILSRKATADGLASPFLLAAIALNLTISVLAGKYMLLEGEAMFFAAASIPVAFKEEFFFRGILQNVIARKRSHGSAIFITNIVFTAYHIGVGPEGIDYGIIFMAGALFSFIYARTGNIWVVISLHALDDALLSFSPYIQPTWHPGKAFILLAAPSAVLALIWARGFMRRAAMAGKASRP